MKGTGYNFICCTAPRVKVVVITAMKVIELSLIFSGTISSQYQSKLEQSMHRSTQIKTIGFRFKTYSFSTR